MNNIFRNNCKNIKVKSRESVFNGLVLREPINDVVLHKLINSDLLQTTCHSVHCQKCENEKTQLEAYRLLCKDGYAHVVYNKNKLGRAIANNGYSLLNIRRQIRHTLVSDTMIDVDIDCCHHVLMSQMLRSYKFKCILLNSYIRNRDAWFERVNNFYRIGELLPASEVRDCIKNLFIRLLYHGTIESWIVDYKINQSTSVTNCLLYYGVEFTSEYDDIIGIPEFLQEFINELKEIGDIFVKENPELYAEISKRKERNMSLVQSLDHYVAQLCKKKKTLY